MKKVLWLTSWYPNLIEPLAGDFIERHARAVSLIHSVSVIHVLRDSRGVTKGKVFKERRPYNNTGNAIIVYYQVPFQKIKWLARAISAFVYIRLFVREVRNYIATNGKPDLVHVHVSQNAGLVAAWLKWYYKIPYVITEHWSGFCPGVHPNFDDQGLLKKLVWKIVMKQASGVTTVSDYLGNALSHHLKELKYSVIPNVVNTSIFRPGARVDESVFRFIHVSSLTYIKNPGQLLEAVKILSTTTNRKFEILIYGPRRPGLIALVEKLNIQNIIIFKNETTQELLADDMRKAHALFLYSISETFGCVVIEANACGLPVVVSDIPAFRENVRENITGVFVPLDQPAKLAETLSWMIEHRSRFNREQIASITDEKYNFNAVAAQFDRFYNEILN